MLGVPLVAGSFGLAHAGAVASCEERLTVKVTLCGDVPPPAQGAVNPPFMSADGIQRYWKKHVQGAA